MEFDIIIEYIQSNPGKSTIEAIFGIAFMLLLNKMKDAEFRVLVVRTLKNIIKYFKGKKLESHYLFDDYKTLLYVSKNIKFDCEDKSKAFSILIEERIKITIDTIRAWIKQNRKSFNSWDKLKFGEEFGSMISNINTKYKEKVRTVYYAAYGKTKGELMYDAIFKGDGGFDNYDIENCKILDAFISNIFIYERLTNIKLIYKFFGIVDTILSITVDNLYVAFKELNGKLCNK